jgi:adenylate kinase
VQILLLGPQGSGKGTQAKRIAAEYGLPHVATGDIIRAMKEEETPLGREVKAVYDRGDLVSDELMIRLIRERLGHDDASGGFILDGFPRTLAQAEALDEVLRELHRELDVVFEFRVEDERTLIDRMLKRAHEEGRSDDTPDAIARRLELYRRETAPLVEYYRTRQGNVVGIHAGRSVNQVFAELQETLERVQNEAIA